MIIAGIKIKWDGFPWQKKRRSNRLIKINSARERSISILQNRYGYSRAEATRQLDKYYPRAWLG